MKRKKYDAIVMVSKMFNNKDMRAFVGMYFVQMYGLNRIIYQK